MNRLKLAFLLAALLIVGADAVLLFYARSFHDSLEARLAREGADEARRALVEVEERRSWREYEPYVVPQDALANALVLVRSPLAEPLPGVRAHFALTREGPGAPLRLRVPYFTDGAGALDPADALADEKAWRLKRIEALAAGLRAAVGEGEGKAKAEPAPALRDAVSLTCDNVAPEVLESQAEPARAAADIDEVKKGNVDVQRKLEAQWSKVEGSNRYQKDQQFRQRAYAQQQEQQQTFSMPQEGQSYDGRNDLSSPVPAPEVPDPLQAVSPPARTYDVRATSFRTIRVAAASATLHVRRVEFVPSGGLPAVGPYWQAFEVDEAALPSGLAVAESLRTSRLLMHGAAALIFLLGTGGLFVLHGAVASRLELAQRRSEFNAAVSHELKAPLAGIRALAEMIHEGLVTSPEKVKEYVANILHESERLSRLIANVLDTARLERRERTYAVRAADPAPAVREAVEIFRTHLVGRGFTFDVAVPDALPAALHERDALVQALANLIDNAAKYTAPCPIRKIAVRAAPRGDREIAIDVEDTGIGIAPDERARIFEPYRRGRDPLAQGTGGTGLGLPIAKTHVEAMGGRIEVEGEKGRGSTFRIVLRRE